MAAAESERVRGELGLAGRAAVIGHVGRFDRQKNHQFLLEVAAELHKRQPQVGWLLVGDGETRPAIERRARRLGLEGSVIFAGVREDVRRLMRNAMDGFLLPSLHEGLPLALLEAQAGGLPCLASSRISPEAVVVPGAVEFLPLEAGPAAWADRALSRISAGRRPCGQARAQVEAAGFSIDQSLEALLAAYRHALGEGQAARSC